MRARRSRRSAAPHARRSSTWWTWQSARKWLSCCWRAIFMMAIGRTTTRGCSSSPRCGGWKRRTSSFSSSPATTTRRARSPRSCGRRRTSACWERKSRRRCSWRRSASPSTVRVLPSPSVKDDLSAGYPPADSSFFNIGMLHTSLDGRPGYANYAPCTVAGLRSRGYQYWALGHVHEREEVSRDPWIVFPRRAAGTARAGDGCEGGDPGDGRGWRGALRRGSGAGRDALGCLRRGLGGRGGDGPGSGDRGGGPGARGGAGGGPVAGGPASSWVAPARSTRS